jgi:hypothetical protein
MPDTALFLKGFDIRQSMILEGYSLDHINILHEQVVRWNEYEYPMKLDFNWISSGTPNENSLNKLYQALGNIVGDIRVIRTQSNRPYECSFTWPLNSGATVSHSNDYKQIDFMFTGYAKRISESLITEVENGHWQ